MAAVWPEDRAAGSASGPGEVTIILPDKEAPTLMVSV